LTCFSKDCSSKCFLDFLFDPTAGKIAPQALHVPNIGVSPAHSITSLGVCMQVPRRHYGISRLVFCQSWALCIRFLGETPEPRPSCLQVVLVCFFQSRGRLLSECSALTCCSKLRSSKCRLASALLYLSVGKSARHRLHIAEVSEPFDFVRISFAASIGGLVDRVTLNLCSTQAPEGVFH
jgi:hypothetical protein